MPTPLMQGCYRESHASRKLFAAETCKFLKIEYHDSIVYELILTYLAGATSNLTVGYSFHTSRG